ncbi:MAG TPA: isocitrate lyase/phosphoenolpyruvate mutase family protein [Myxococcota bacterium]|jgi:2-methylisocitrate lyase-like PEP mutase family enzyme
MPQSEHAAQFHSFHAKGELLRLPNAWDAGSARLFEASGARAIATTSAGLAWSLGYADGNHVPARVLEAATREIARVVRVPLSVDAEAGLARDAAAVGETIAALIGAGAVGVNLEDGTDPPDLLCAKIEAAKRAGARAGIPLFVNARTDVYLKGLVPKERARDEAIARGHTYRAAGADGFFVPGLADPETIRAVVAAVDSPLNLLLVPTLPSPRELQALGVRRVSAGSSIAMNAYSFARREALALLGDGQPTAASLGYAEMNALFR